MKAKICASGTQSPRMRRKRHSPPTSAAGLSASKTARTVSAQWFTAHPCGQSSPSYRAVFCREPLSRMPPCARLSSALADIPYCSIVQDYSASISSDPQTCHSARKSVLQVQPPRLIQQRQFVVVVVVAAAAVVVDRCPWHQLFQHRATQPRELPAPCTSACALLASLSFDTRSRNNAHSCSHYRVETRLVWKRGCRSSHRPPGTQACRTPSAS